jgi:hypothetical protein
VSETIEGCRQRLLDSRRNQQHGAPLASGIHTPTAPDNALTVPLQCLPVTISIRVELNRRIHLSISFIRAPIAVDGAATQISLREFSYA